MQVLELAEILGRLIQVAIVDDGSTDGTYEAACELSRQFPQIVILRQPFQRGLGAALELVRLRMGVDQVVAHDGLTPINLDDLAALLTASGLDRPALKSSLWEAALEGRGSRRVAPPAGLLPSGRAPSGAAGSFRWLRLDGPLMPRRQRSTPSPAPHAAVLPLPLAGGANTCTASPAGVL
jgi:hypothetical protein